MRYASRFPAALALLVGLAVITPANAQSPTTHPSDGKILILPFTALNSSESQPWLGRSIQQSLLADLTTAAPGRLLSLDAQAADMSAAAGLARSAGASYVVAGSFTTLSTSAGQGLRITGEVIEVDGIRAVAAFKATGLSNEMFRLEDQVATQMRLRLGETGVLPRPAPAVQLTTPPPATADLPVEMPQVNEYYQAYAMPQPYVDPQAAYNYYYANPYAGAGYGYGVGIGFPFFFGSYYAHGSNFGGFDGGRFGSHDHHGPGGHGGASASAGGSARGGHR